MLGRRAIVSGRARCNPRDAGDRYEQHSTLNDSACADQWFLFHFRRDVSSVEHIGAFGVGLESLKGAMIVLSA